MLRPNRDYYSWVSCRLSGDVAATVFATSQRGSRDGLGPRIRRIGGMSETVAIPAGYRFDGAISPPLRAGELVAWPGGVSTVAAIISQLKEAAAGLTGSSAVAAIISHLEDIAAGLVGSSVVGADLEARTAAAAELSGSSALAAALLALGILEAQIGPEGGPGPDEIAQAVWTYLTRSLTNPEAVWAVLESSVTTPGSIGEHILRNLDAPVSSRATSGPPLVSASPVDPITGDVRIYAGDDYDVADANRAIGWRSKTWPDLSGATLTATVRNKDTDIVAFELESEESELEVVDAGEAEQGVRVLLLACEKSVLLTEYGRHYRLDVEATLVSGNRVTLVDVYVIAAAKQTRA